MGLLVSLVSMVLGLSSCLEIYENLHFHKDGSGKAEFVYDISQMLEMMQSMEGMGDINSEENVETDNESSPTVWDNMAKSYDSLVDVFQTIPGIHNLVLVKEKEASRFLFRFDFDNVNTLNIFLSQGGHGGSMAALEGVLGTDNQPFEYFSWKKGKLVRKLKTRESGVDSNNEDQAMARSMFSNLFYYFNYTFEGKIKKAEGPSLNWKKGDTACAIKMSLLEVLDAKTPLQYNYSYK